MQSDVRYLYGRPLELNTQKGKVVLSPIDVPDWDCVQYCPRMPSDSDGRSVHYEVYTVKDNEKMLGYRVALHGEGQTLDGNGELRKNLVAYLRRCLYAKGLRNSRFMIEQGSVNLDVHSNAIIPHGLSESDLMPESKQLNHEQYLQLEHQSLKLRIMAEVTRQRRMQNQTWDQDVCSEHERWMLDLLKEDAGYVKEGSSDSSE